MNGVTDPLPTRRSLRLPRARALDARPESAWREAQLEEVAARLEARRAATRAERDRRWARHLDADDHSAAWCERERRRLRDSLGVAARPHRQRLHRRVLGVSAGPQVESWRIHDEAGLIGHGYALIPDAAIAAAMLVGGTDAAFDLETAEPWLGPLLARRVAVVIPVRAGRLVDGPISRRSAGKDHRHVLHRVGFGIGRTPEGLEIDALRVLGRVVRRRLEPGASIALVGVDGGERLVALTAAVTGGWDLVGLGSGGLPELDADGPVDERLYGSASLPSAAGLRHLIEQRANVVEVVDPVALADRLVSDGRANRSAHPDSTVRSSVPAGDAVVPNAIWAGDPERRLVDDWDRRLRSELATVTTRRRETLAAVVPEPARASVTKRRQDRLAVMVRGPKSTRDRSTARRRRPAVAARLLRVTDAFVAHEVELDVGGGRHVWGQLLRPRGTSGPGPAVICQHGLDGVPGDITGLASDPDSAYHAFGARLAERGYTVFAPYLAVPAPQADRLDRPVRAALAVGAMRADVDRERLGTVIDVLAGLPGVNPERIGYYGLSYGGYTATWLAGLEPRLAAIVISGHFNDWATKLTDDRDDASFLRHPDEDFTTWRALLDSTHAELIAAMWPRPVLVEWADGDPTTNPVWHGRAWEEVERWAEGWGVSDRVGRTAFHGIHEVAGHRSFEFLDRWLRPERASGRDYVYDLQGRGRDLDGISDHAPDTLPYLTTPVDQEHVIRDVIHLGSGVDRLGGLTLRVSRVGEPGALMVTIGTTRDAADVATYRLGADAIHPVWDLWYELRGSEVTVTPGGPLHVSVRAEAGVLPADGYLAYGPRPLGGEPTTDDATFAFRVLQADDAPTTAEPTHAFGRRLLDDALEPASREAPASQLRAGVVRERARFAPRITTIALPAGVRYSEVSHESTYTDGALRKIARDGFDAVWVWVNLEEIAHDSAVFPDLDEPLGRRRLERLEAAAQRAARHGVDLYVYLASTYDHPVPEWFYRRHPELRGYGFFGHPMCTSDARVRAYHAEIVTRLARAAPTIRGLIVNFDIEGYYYCGNDERFRRRCPRCRRRAQETLAHEVLTNLHGALQVDDPTKRMIIWSYGDRHDWVERLLPTLPSDIALQVDMSKGLRLERDGVVHETGDYNLTLIGPPPHLERLRAVAAASGHPFIVKTEHAVSQEAIFVPYIPAMDQWAARAEAIRAIPAQGWFGNWDHYGYLESVPARIVTDASMLPTRPMEEILDSIATEAYGAGARPHVRAAWTAFSEAIRAFPYSDRVARSPGPLQKGPSHPLWLDPAQPNVSHWRSWQNDLDWTAPWGPVVAERYLRRVRDGFTAGIDHLERAREHAAAPYREALDAERRVARTIEASLTTVLHLIAWIPLRDAFAASADAADRRSVAARLRRIAQAERRNALAILPLLEMDSRLGFASDGGGVVRGGLFTPALVRWKVGQLDDLLVRELPDALAAIGSA